MPTLRDFPRTSLIFETSHCHWQEELTRRLSRPAGRSLLGAGSTLDLHTSCLLTKATRAYTGLICRNAYLERLCSSHPTELPPAGHSSSRPPPYVTRLRDFTLPLAGGAYSENEQTCEEEFTWRMS